MSARWVVRAAVAAVALSSTSLLAAPLAAASAPVSKALQSKFVAIDTPLAKAAAAWTSGVEGVPASAAQAQVTRALVRYSPAYVAALGSFDKQLAALGLPGKAGSDAIAVIKDNNQLLTLLRAASTITKAQFASGFGAIFKEEGTLQLSFRVDLGLPASAAIQI